MSKKDSIWILYDGKCPFCRNYISFVRLREHLEPHLIDARDETVLKAEASAAGLNLDEGMVVKYQDRLYHGHSAMMLLESFSTQSGLFNRFMAWLFRTERRARFIYPIFAFLRGVVVGLLGHGKISNLTK